MKSILITGGAGFIGSHTCLYLIEKGYVIFILDSFINSSQKSIEKISFFLNENDFDSKEKIYLINGDIRNSSDIEKVFQMSIKLNKRIKSFINFQF